MFDLFSSCKSTNINNKLLEKEHIDPFDIEIILCTSNLNKVLSTDLQKLKECIVLMQSNQISFYTFQGLMLNLSSKSSTEVWDILFACMKNSPLNLQSDSCCQMNLFSNVFSNDELNLLPQSWFVIFLSDMCYIHTTVYPETPETSRILIHMFSKLSTVVPEMIIENTALDNVIENGIKKFSKLGTPFWDCRYFGNKRLIWLHPLLNNMTSKDSTIAIDCIMRSIQWHDKSSLPQSWIIIFLTYLCNLHSNVIPETPLTSQILIYMFSKLSTVVPEMIIQNTALDDIIRVGIKKFSKLGTPFWFCGYFGITRLEWLHLMLCGINETDSTGAFDCIMKSMQWDKITSYDDKYFLGLSFSKIKISIHILEYLFENLDQEYRQLPYIYTLIYKTDIHFKQNFYNHCKLKEWRIIIATRLRNFIEIEVKHKYQLNRFTYAVCALYFIWHRGDEIYFSNTNAYNGNSVKTYIQKYRSPVPLFYEGNNLIACMYH